MGDSRSSADVPFDDIPQSVLEEVRLGIQHYFVPLLLLSPEDPTEPVVLGGSGTLVELVGRHYILTADHVWNKAARWAQIGLVLEAEGGAPLTIETNPDSPPKRLAADKYTEWGPDLALLEIPPHLVPSIRARKSFLNLARRRSMFEAHPLRMEKALWAVVGLVRESSTVEPPTDTGVVFANLRAEAFFGVRCTADQRSGYDYLTLNAKTTLPGVPSSFDGVSGGGLWQITLKVKAGAIVWQGEHHFCGVAFWQKPEPPDQISIRCHGPRSIFQKGWEAWGLSSG